MPRVDVGMTRQDSLALVEDLPSQVDVIQFGPVLVDRLAEAGIMHEQIGGTSIR